MRNALALYNIKCRKPGSAVTGIGPAVTTQPKDATVTDGAVAEFFAQANGHPTPWVQWQVLTTDTGASWEDLDGEDRQTLKVTATASMTGYQYHAVFTNSTETGGTTTTNDVELTVGT